MPGCKPKLVRLLLAAAACVLTSCFDAREEYWLNADGSGRVEAAYSIPAAAAAMHGGPEGVRGLIDGFLKHTPEISSSGCEVKPDGKQLHVKLRASFDSALKLKEVAGGDSIRKLSGAASGLAGEVEAELHGRTLEFRRRISVAEALPGAAFLPDSRLEGHGMVYIMHLPAAATESNATRTEDSGRTLVWEFPLKQALAAPQTTRFKMDLPVPWALVASIAVPVSLACGFAFVGIRNSRKRSAMVSPPRVSSGP